MRRSRWGAYPLQTSPLYGLRSKRKLAELIGIDVRALKRIARKKNNYIKFTANRGSEKERAIQAPLPRLAQIHSRVFELLRRIKPPHYLKSGVPGESQITNASVHILNERGFKFDIRQFFPNVKRSHVFGCFYSLFDMSPDVADLLTDLCIVDGALPTGSTLSGDLAFMSNWSMFNKLSAVADEFELNMTVYVDDITVTGMLATRQVYRRMISVVESHGFICHKEVFFRPHRVKTITGVAIQDGKMKLPNRRHKKIHERFLDLDNAANEEEFITTARSVIGMMEAADQVIPKFQIRKKSLRQEIAVLEG